MSTPGVSISGKILVLLMGQHVVDIEGASVLLPAVTKRAPRFRSHSNSRMAKPAT